MKKATKLVMIALMSACMTCTASGCSAIDSAIDSPLVSMIRDLVEDAGIAEYMGEYFDFGDFFNGNDKESAKDDASDSTESGSGASGSSGLTCAETGIHEMTENGVCIWCNQHEHMYTELSEVIKPATCTEAGQAKYVCVNGLCNSAIEKEIPALGHLD